MHPIKKILFTFFGALILLFLSPLLLLLAIIIFPLEWLLHFFEKQKVRRAGYPAPYHPGVTKTVLFQAFCRLSPEQKATATLLSDWELSLSGTSPSSLLVPETTCVFIPEEAPEGVVRWETGDWIAENGDAGPPVRINLSARARELENSGITPYVLLSPDTKVKEPLPESFFRFAEDGSLPPLFPKQKDR